MAITVVLYIARFFNDKSLFEQCIALSLALHFALFCTWHLRGNLIPAVNYDPGHFESFDIDLDNIPPELLSGHSDPAPVEVQEWTEGSNKKKKADAPADDTKENALSGTGADRDGYLYSIKGDRPPRPLFNFDLKKFFPFEARKANIRNQLVIVRVQVDETGKLISSSVISHNTGYGFDKAAVQVLSMARFIPGYRDGAPVKMVHDLPVRFVLDN